MIASCKTDQITKNHKDLFRGCKSVKQNEFRHQICILGFILYIYPQGALYSKLKTEGASLAGSMGSSPCMASDHDG